MVDSLIFTKSFAHNSQAWVAQSTSGGWKMWIPVQTAKTFGQKSRFICSLRLMKAMTEKNWPSPHGLKHVRDKEMDLWCGTLSLPSCVDGAGFIPFPLYLRRVRVKAQIEKDLPVTLHWHSGPFWDRDVISVWEKVTCVPSYLRMSVCTPVTCVLTAYKLHLNCKMKMCPLIWRQLEGKESALESVTRVVITPSELLWDALFDPRDLQCG